MQNNQCHPELSEGSESIHSSINSRELKKGGKEAVFQGSILFTPHGSP